MSEVEVKALEWGPHPIFGGDDLAVANIAEWGEHGHKYQAGRDADGPGYKAFLAPVYGSWFWTSPGHETLEAAKAAAQADFDARIRSALVDRKAEPEECEKCVGTGTVEDAGRPIGMGGFMKCPDCNGTGHASPSPVDSRSSLVERKAEPVAWRYRDSKYEPWQCDHWHYLSESAQAELRRKYKIVEPLFSTPPAEPVTGEENEPCAVCGNEERGQGGYLSCECPAPPPVGESRDAALVEVLTGYEAWEASVIEDADWSNDTPRLTQHQFHWLLRLQDMRNKALAAKEQQP